MFSFFSLIEAHDVSCFNPSVNICSSSSRGKMWMLTTDSLYIQCLMVNRLLSVASMEPVMSPIHCGNLKRTGRLEGKVSCHLIRNHPKPKPTFSYCLPKTTDRSPFSSHKHALNHRFFLHVKKPCRSPKSAFIFIFILYEAMQGWSNPEFGKER